MGVLVKRAPRADSPLICLIKAGFNEGIEVPINRGEVELNEACGPKFIRGV
jgi:hypothetical protein